MPNDPTPPARIQPRTLKGFRDYLPETMIPRQRCMDTARDVFQRFGFAPIDTPALEYLEVLTGKGSEETDRQMFYFTDNGGRNVGMRFDLTVPLARFAAQHAATLGTPFRRFHIAPVWRGETPQKGRFREFIQCDFDTIGTRSVAADTEIVLVIHQLLTALDVPGFKIHLNNRQVLTGLLQHLGLENLSTAILRSLDKLGKIGREKTAAEMVSAAGISASDADAVLRLADLQGDTMQVLDDLPSVTGGNETAAEGTNRLRAIVDNAIASGVSADQVQLDVSIARGLDYYTGVIFETFLDDLPQIGSVCSGGRYDNLAGMFTKQDLPGVGASLGLDRLLAALEQLQLLPSVSTPAPVFLPYFASEHLTDYLRIAAQLRSAGIGVELYPDPKKLGKQLQYADRKGFRLAVIAGTQELSENRVQLKNLADKSSRDVPYSPESPGDLIQAISGLLNP